MNCWGLIGGALLSIAVAILPFAITERNWLLTVFSLPFAVVGVIGLIDDLFLHEKVIKRLLSVE